MKKPEPLKSRGIRFSEEQWAKIESEVKKDKTGRTKPSNVVRHAVDKLFENLDG
jgi:hypothetical protein